MTSPASATDFANDRLVRSLAKARWPQIIDGTAVKPNVSSAKTPSVKAQIGSADNSSSERLSMAGALVVLVSIMSVMTARAGKFAHETACNGLLVASSSHLIQRTDE